MSTQESFIIRVAKGLLVTLVLSSVVSADDTLLPDLGDRESAALSPYEEESLGRAFLMQIHRNVPTVDDPILKYFVRKNLYELAAVSYTHLTLPTKRIV